MTDKPTIDESLHSRQLAVYGHETMKRIQDHKVLISGMNGLGAEVAKNVILANLGVVTLHDTVATSWMDLSSHFYLSEKDIGKNRAEACCASLQELNTTVAVSATTEPLSANLLLQYQTVVILDSLNPESHLSEAQLVEFNELCRSQPTPINFIVADTVGVFARCFCDFGPKFTVVDTDGEQPHTGIIASITEEEKDGKKALLVTCVDEDRLEFQDGNFVTFGEVEGLDGLNSAAPLPMTMRSPYSFTVPVPENVSGTYKRGGVITQVKMPKVIEFRSLGDCNVNPTEYLESDFSKFGRSAVLHVALRALHKISSEKNELPAPGDEAAIATLVSTTTEINAQMGDSGKVSDEDLGSDGTKDILSALAHSCRGTVNPMCAVIGGIVGQEITKAASGKFHPLHQMFYLDAIEALPSPLPSPSDCQPLGSRYDGQIAVFGKPLQDKLHSFKLFMVGAGALGCELLKNYAVMGVGTKAGNGRIIITDDDTIERSNLSRQFLFRNWHVGKGKAKTACEAATTMNSDLELVPMEDRVSPQTESTFNDKFWQELTIVTNALDNVKARLYVDTRCVFFGKPLLESGTLGTKCNTQVVIPHKTEHYGASADPPEKQAPDCTLHNFPHTINHCLSWGRSEFIGNFETAPGEVKAFLSCASVDAYIALLEGAGSVPEDVLEKLTAVHDALGDAPKTFEDCVAWARRKFEDYFSDRIKQLTHSFPRDAKTSSGMPFWSPPKRFPEAVTFSIADPLHKQFIVAASHLRAKVCRVTIPANAQDSDFLSKVVESMIIPDFVPKKGVQIETDPNAQSRGGVSIAGTNLEAKTAELKESLTALKSSTKVEMVPEEFEKDDDTNFHMDFIASVGNLRGRAYGINEIDKFRAKLVAGRIIPAIATTTAMATGLVCLELLKVAQDKDMEQYRNTFANLALPLFAMSEPMPPKKFVSRTVKSVPDPINHPEYEEEEDIVSYPEGHTIWDKLEIRDVRAMTLEQLFAKFKELYGFDTASFVVSSTDGKGIIVYNQLMPATKKNTALSVEAMITEKMKADPKGMSYFTPSVMFENDAGDTVEIPELILWL